MSRICLLCWLVLVCGSLAAEPSAGQPSGQVGNAKYETPLPIERYALVVGVQNYREHDPVPNAVNDAQAVGKALERTGTFKHIRVLENPDSKEDILAAVAEILQRAGDGAATIVFYFAGHGFQFDGANYLVPGLAGKPVRNPSVRETNKEPLVRASLNIETITYMLGERPAGANILFIDACRTHILGVNAIDPSTEPKGFLKLTNPRGALISFSAGFGEVANSQSRYTPRNSPYAAVLSENIPTEAIPLNPILLATLRSQVIQATGVQKPEPLHPDAAGSFFYFQATPTEKAAELAMWRKAMMRRTRNCIDNFLHHYRDGQLSRQVTVYLMENPIPNGISLEPLCNLLS